MQVFCFIFFNIHLTFIQIKIKMDRLFQASSNPNRLNRRVLGVPRGGESPQEKTTENPRFSRQNRNTAEQKQQQKPHIEVPQNPPRYGANRRAQNINKQQQEIPKAQQNPQPQNSRYGANRRNENNRNKNQQSQEDTTVSSQLPNKNTASRYSVIKRQDTKIEQEKINQETTGSAVQPRYGANRRTVPQNIKQEVAELPKKQESVASRLLQRKPDPTIQNQTPKKQEDNFQPITARYAPVKKPSIPASQLTGEKLQEVQNIVRRPLANQRGSVRDEVPKKQETISPQQPKRQQRKTTSSFVDDFIRPVPRKGRYGQQAKQQTKKEEDHKQNELNQTPKKHLTRTVQNQPNSRSARKPAEPKIPQTNQNPSILSLESNLHENSNTDQSKVTEQRSQVTYKPRRGRPGSQNVPTQEKRSSVQEIPPNVEQKQEDKPKQPYGYRNRGYQAKKVQQTTQSQTQQSSHISNPPQNKTRNDPSSNISQQKSLHSPSVSKATDNLHSNFHKQTVSSFQQPSQQKKSSKILIYSLSRISQKKIKQNFEILCNNTRQVKKKDEIFTKILFNAIANVASKRKFQVIEILAYQIVKPEVQVKFHASEVPKKLQHLKTKNRQFLPKLLNCLTNQHIRSCLIKLQDNVRIKQANCKGINALAHIENTRLKIAFEKIKIANLFKEMHKKRILEKVSSVYKISYKAGLQEVWAKLKQNHCAKIQPSKTEQQPSILSPTRQSPTTKKPIPSPKTSENTSNILKLKRQYQNELTQFTKQKQEWNIELNNQQQVLNILKGNCFEEEQTIQEKKRVQAILKQKISEIEIPEQDYIKEEDPALEDTKYSLLLDTYLVFMKNSRKELYQKEQLESQFPYLKKDAQGDAIVKKWIQVLENKRLKQLMQAYEGIPRLQRKTAEILQNQSNMITQIARSYIKQKYIWGWVKNAVANATLTM